MKLTKSPLDRVTGRLPNLNKSLIGILVLSGLWAATPAAKAGSLTWEYHYDSDTDGYDKKTVGPTSRFEHLGTAYAQEGKKSYIVIYSNIDASGVVYGQKQVRVFTGDLVLDFTGEGNLSNANGSPNLYTIKINGNESSLQLGQIGVGSTLKSVYRTNYGFSTYQNYYDKLQQARTFDGRYSSPSMSDDPSLNGRYFKPGDSTLSVTDRSQSTIDNAVRIINDPLEIQQLGVNLNLPGTTPSKLAKITVIEIDNSQLPSQEFIAALLTECGNDSFAFKAAIVPVVTTPSTSETPTTPTTETPPVSTTTTTPYSISFVGAPEAGGVSTGLIVGGSIAAAALLIFLLLDSGDDATTRFASNPTPNNPGGGGGNSGGGGGNGGGIPGEIPNPRETSENNSSIALALLGLAAFGLRKKVLGSKF